MNNINISHYNIIVYNTTNAVDGRGTAARFGTIIRSLAMDSASASLYASDMNNNAIRCIDISSPDHNVSTIISIPSPGALAMKGVWLYVFVVSDGLYRFDMSLVGNGVAGSLYVSSASDKIINAGKRNLVINIRF